MKILFITTQFPYPLDNGGKIGAYNGLNIISKDNTVTCLSFTEQEKFINEGLIYFKEKLPNVNFIKPIFHDIHIRNKKNKLIQVMIKSYLSNVPYISSKFINKNMYKAIDTCFLDNKWDIVFIDYLNMNIYANYIRNKYKKRYDKLILKDHNKEFEIIKQAASKSKNLVNKLILSYEWIRTLKYEKKAISNADLVYSVCDENTTFFKRFNTNAYTMLPTYELKRNVKKDKNPNGILYIGNLSWRANMDGLRWFVKEVLPLIKKGNPDAVLTVAGSGPTDNFFKNYSSVNYLGYVQDIEKLYEENKVFIVPLFEGSGIRIKILEAFNNEIAVVSTSIGCKTIEATNNSEIVIADSAENFANGVLKLLIDDKFNDDIVDNSKAFLANKYSIDTQAEAFKKVMEMVVNE